jgi:hypothetical protein
MVSHYFRFLLVGELFDAAYSKVGIWQSSKNTMVIREYVNATLARDIFMSENG